MDQQENMQTDPLLKSEQLGVLLPKHAQFYETCAKTIFWFFSDFDTSLNMVVCMSLTRTGLYITA